MPLVQLISEQLLLAVSAPPHVSTHRRTLTYSAFWKMRNNVLGLNTATSTALEVLFRATVRINNLVRMHCRYQKTWFTASRASQTRCYKGIISKHVHKQKDICFCFTVLCIFLRNMQKSKSHLFSNHGNVCGSDGDPLPYPPQVIKQAILKLWQKQCNGCLCIHADDPLASTQGSVPHKLILICQCLTRERSGCESCFLLLSTIYRQGK